MLLTADRVLETSTTTGTGTLNLDGAVSGYRTFAVGIGHGNTCFYAIHHQSANEWEVGIGTVTSGTPDTLARTTIIASSNSGDAVNFSAGDKRVFATLPARLLEYGVRTITGSYQVADSDSLVLVNNSAAITVDLPTAVGRDGKRLRIIKISLNSLGVTIDGNGSQTINGLATWPIYHAGDVVCLESDGANWRVIGDNVPEQKRATTTDATQTTLWSRTLEQNTSYLFRFEIAVSRTGGTAGSAGDQDHWISAVQARRIGSGTAEMTSSSDLFSTGSLLAGIEFDASTNDLRLRITGEADVNYTWYVKVTQVLATRFSD